MGAGLTGGPLTGGPAAATSVVAPAGQSAIIVGPLGAAAADVVTKAGSSVADASVNAAAKLFSVRTGIGGTEVEYASFTKTSLTVAGTIITPNSTTGQIGLAANCQMYGDLGSGQILFRYANGGTRLTINTDTGVLTQYGTDSTGTPGNATINRPSGISSVATGQATCTITNSLVPAVATRRIRIHVTLNSDPGAAVTRVWVTQTAGGGSFVVNFAAVAGADTVFSWQISELV